MEATCAICGEKANLVRDHDHQTGEIRGWLCGRCNVMLGYAADSQDRLSAAAEYLRATGRPPRVGPDEPTPAKRDRAAYMREYRARKGRNINSDDLLLRAAHIRIRDLEAEVARLKRELAARPALGTYSTRPFTPVPKTR